MKSRFVYYALLVVLPSVAVALPCGPITDCGGAFQTKVSCPGGALEAEPCNSTCGWREYNECNVSSPLYSLAIAAAKAEDVKSVLAFGRTLPRYVVFNPGRSAIQSLSCGGDAVIASFSVTGEIARVAESSLARVPADLRVNAALTSVGFHFEEHASASPAEMPMTLRVANASAAETLSDFAGSFGF